jgi:hypothetical protein
MLRVISIDSFHHGSLSIVAAFARATFPDEKCLRWKVPPIRELAGDGETVVVVVVVVEERSAYRRRCAVDLERAMVVVGFSSGFLREV